MTTWKEKRMSGRKAARFIKSEVSERAAILSEKGIVPGLAVILVGDDPASAVYVGMKEKACAKTGIASSIVRLTEDADESTIIDTVGELNLDNSIHGILVQLPLPAGISESRVIEAIKPEKDVDGLHPVNMGRLLRGEETTPPCTPAGILHILRFYSVETAGAEVVIAGRSNIVGKPLAAMMVQKKRGANATVTFCHTATRDLASHTRNADIVIVAVGYPEVITGDMIREGAVVVDVGVNRISRDGSDKLVGDCHFESCAERASLITPVPGGIGPMTIAMLLKNTVNAATAAAKQGSAS